MSGEKVDPSGMMSGAKTGEEFIAVLLWTQKSKCQCPACKYFRNLAKSLAEKHGLGGVTPAK